MSKSRSVEIAGTSIGEQFRTAVQTFRRLGGSIEREGSIELIEAAKAGGRAEIESLLEAVWPDAYRLARAILPGNCSAEDAAQDACVTMYRSIAALKDVRAFSTWFYRIVVHHALKHKKLQPAPAPQQDDASYDKDPSEVVDLLRALRELSARSKGEDIYAL